MPDIRLPDGRILRGVPEGITRAEIEAKIGPVSAAPQRREPLKIIDPTEDFKPFEGETVGKKLFIGFDKGVTDIGRGIEQFVRNIIPGVSEEEKALQQRIDESKRQDDPILSSGLGFGGNLLGLVAGSAPAGAIRGAGTLLGGTLVGAGLGGLQPVATGDSRLGQTALGAGGGFLGTAAARSLARALSPQTAPGAQQLISEGVTPTPGQVLGGAAGRIEEGLTSVPILGDAIRGAQRRSLKEFNVAAANRALDDIGKKVPEKITGGRELVAHVEDAIQGEYDRILPKITFKKDAAYDKGVARALEEAKILPQVQREQLDQILKNELFSKIKADGTLSGDVVKIAESQLSLFARRLRGSQDFNNQFLGETLSKIRNQMIDNVIRKNPKFGGDLKNTNRSFAKFVRIQDAASRAGQGLGDAGTFTPAQLAQAVRKADPSVRKRQFARGDALLQDLSDTAKDVLSKMVPDSGTPLRALIAALTAVGGAAIDPLIPATLLGGGAAFTKPGQRLLVDALTRRTPGVRRAGEAIGRAAPLSGILGASTLNAL